MWSRGWAPGRKSGAGSIPFRPDLPGEQHRRCDQKARRRVFAERIANDLFADELIVGRVLVEGANDVIAIWPRVRTLGVDLEAVRVRVAHDIQPVLRPTFAVAWRSEEFVHDALVGIATTILHEGIDLLLRWRQSDEIEIDPPQPAHAIRLRRRLEPLLVQARENNAIDVVPCPLAV